MDGIKASLMKRKDDEEMGTEMTRVDIIKCIQSEKIRFRGVNLSGLDLSKLVRHPYSVNGFFDDYTGAKSLS